MNPKLLRHYSNILNEYQTGNIGKPGNVSKPGSAAPLPSNPNAPAYNTGVKPAKIGTQNFNMAGGAAKPTAKPAAPNYSAAVKSANAAFAANQAKAPQGDQTAGGKTNAAFLPGAAGGATPDAMAGADAGNQTSSGYTAQSQAQKTPDAAATPAPQANALGIQSHANVPQFGAATSAAPASAADGSALGIQSHANVPQFGAATSAAPASATSSTSRALPITTSGGPTAATPTSVNPATRGGPAVTGGFGQETNITTDSPDQIAKRGPMGIQRESELEEDNELSELMRLSGRTMNKPKVSESFMLEAGSTLEHIIKKFKHETKNFLAGNDLDSDLYDALYDYYSDNGEMPYGVAKARDGDPYQWIGDRFADEMQMHGYGRQSDMLNAPSGDRELTELARLAGLSESQVAECGDMDMEQNDSMNVSTNMNSDGTKSVSISAQGDRADALLQMLKMAGMRPHDNDNSMGMTEPEVIMVSSAPHNDMHDEEMMDEEELDEYANTSKQEYQTIDSILRQGDDLNREKAQHPVAGFTGDNPMSEEVALDEELQSLLDSILVREEMTDVLKAEQPYRDEKTGKMVTPPKGATMPPADSPPTAKPGLKK